MTDRWCINVCRIVVFAVPGRWLSAPAAVAIHLLLRGAATAPGVQTLAGAAAALPATAARGRSPAPVLARKGHVHSYRSFRVEFRFYRTPRNTLKKSKSRTLMLSSLVVLFYPISSVIDRCAQSFSNSLSSDTDLISLDFIHFFVVFFFVI